MALLGMLPENQQAIHAQHLPGESRGYGVNLASCMSSTLALVCRASGQWQGFEFP